jgi:GT2 family glycosyltransferase
MSAKQIYIIIPVHNRVNYTLKCLNSLVNQTYTIFSIILIDDGSTDNTSSIVSNKFPNVKILKGDGHLWWSGSVNLGIRYAIKLKADYILLLNNDLIVDNNYLESILAKSNNTSLIGSVLVNKNNKQIIDGGSWLNLFTAKKKDLNIGKKINNIRNHELIKVNVLPGRGVLIPINVFEKVGLFNEEKLPQYAADYEFSIRALKNNYKLFCNYDSIIFSQEPSFDIKSRYSQLTWFELIKSFFSIRSSNGLKYRYRFAVLAFGYFRGVPFFIFDAIRTMSSNIIRKVKYSFE